MAGVGVGVKDVLHTRHDLHVYSVGLSPYNGGCSAVPLDSCGWWLRMRKDDRKQPQFIVYYYYKCVYCDELNVWVKERLEAAVWGLIRRTIRFILFMRIPLTTCCAGRLSELTRSGTLQQFIIAK